MGHNTHEDVAARWVNRILYPGRDALRSNNLHDRGDRIDSYGAHFEVGRVLRNRQGEPIGWLLNGDRWDGVVTTRHQNAVLRAINSASNLPRVTIPHTALNAAGIANDSVEIIDVQRDWTTTRTITKQEMVGKWSYEYDYSEPYGFVNSLTGEFRERTNWSSAPVEACECDRPGLIGPWKPGYNWERSIVERKLTEIHMRLHHGVWESVTPHRRNTGRKTPMATKYTPWEMVDAPESPLGYVFQRDVQRHWLGASLIKAQVPYTVRVKHQACGGTGIGEKWYTRVHPGYGQFVSGPLTEQDMQVAQTYSDRSMERNGGIRQPFGWQDLRLIEAFTESTRCRGCGVTGRVNAERRRTAYFLSGFDENETRPSYFFCELPPKARPTTVAEAYDALKPQSVKLAEQAGRDVKRQGDIFAIPMPGLTLRELKAQGGRHIRKPKLVDRDGHTFFDGPRPQLLGTNHEATEVVLVGKQTYARGVIRHVPEFRAPDHKALTIGREWHLIQKNTVPVGV